MSVEIHPLTSKSLTLDVQKHRKPSKVIPPLSSSTLNPLTSPTLPNGMAVSMFLIVALGALCLTLQGAQGATIFGKTLSTSPYIGLGGELNDVAHLMKDQTTGDVTIVSDSAFEVTNFTYTGMAPSVHWVSAMSTSPADLEKYMLLNPDRVTMNYTMADVIVPVMSNVSWANVNVLALYCTEYKALFGSVNLKEALAMKMPMSGMGMSPSMGMAAVTPGGRKML